MMLTDCEQYTIDRLANLLEGIILSLEEDYNKNVNSYPDLLKAKNILQGRNASSVKAIRKRLRSGFRMVDESLRVSDDLNRKINDAYEIAATNKIFDVA